MKRPLATAMAMGIVFVVFGLVALLPQLQDIPDRRLGLPIWVSGVILILIGIAMLIWVAVLRIRQRR